MEAEEQNLYGSQVCIFELPMKPGLMVQLLTTTASLLQRSRVRIPFKPGIFFRLSFCSCISCLPNYILMRFMYGYWDTRWLLSFLFLPSIDFLSTFCSLHHMSNLQPGRGVGCTKSPVLVRTCDCFFPSLLILQI